MAIRFSLAKIIQILAFESQACFLSIEVLQSNQKSFVAVVVVFSYIKET